MKFSQLAEYWNKLDQISGRLDMTGILTEILEKADPEEVSQIIYLSLGRLGPKHDNPEFNMASKMVLRSISQAYETSIEKVTQEYKKLGDVGITVHKLGEHELGKSPSRPNPQTVSDIYRQFIQIAQDSGTGSQDRKVAALASLFKSADPLSAKYLARIPVGKLRLGFGEMTFIDALSFMIAGDKSLHDTLEEAYNVRADIGLLAQKVKEEILHRPELSHQSSSHQDEHSSPLKKGDKKGLSVLSNIQIQVGTPVIAALCQRLKSFDEIIEKLGKVAVEPKYDGTRLQIHWQRTPPLQKSRKELVSLKSENNIQNTLFDKAEQSKYQSTEQPKHFIKTFTRNLEENSHMFPELQKLGDVLPNDIESVIFDCEAIGYDPETGKQVPFQITMTRKRKHE